MQKYFKFPGTATRSEYWGVQIISMVVATVLMLGGLALMIPAPVVGGLMLLALFVAYLWLAVATAVRRCRDAAINPWWVLAMLVPYVGFVVWIVIGCLKTDEQTVKTAQPQP